MDCPECSIQKNSTLAIERNCSASLSEKSIQIFVWNVNKLSRHTRNPDFKHFCQSYEIIFLVET